MVNNSIDDAIVFLKEELAEEVPCVYGPEIIRVLDENPPSRPQVSMLLHWTALIVGKISLNPINKEADCPYDLSDGPIVLLTHLCKLAYQQAERQTDKGDSL